MSEEQKADDKQQPNTGTDELVDKLVSDVLHSEPANDPEAAKHGAKKFALRFSDAEVHRELDRVAGPDSLWMVTVHGITAEDVGDDGHPVIRHWMKHGDRFPQADIEQCIIALAGMVAESMPIERIGDMAQKVKRRIEMVFRDRQRKAEMGMFGSADSAPETFADTED